VGETPVALEQDRTNQLFLSMRDDNAQHRNSGTNHGARPHNRDRGNRATHKLGGVNHIVIAFCDRPGESTYAHSPKLTPLTCFTVFLTTDKPEAVTRLAIHWCAGIRATPCEPRLTRCYRRIP